MTQLIILIRTKDNQIPKELSEQIFNNFCPNADIITTGETVTDPKWLGKKLKKKRKMLVCIFDGKEISDIFASLGGPSSTLANVLLNAPEGKSSWEIVSEYAADKDMKYRIHLERYKKESEDGLLHANL